MGFAQDHLSSEELANIASSLFEVTTREQRKGEIHGLCPIHGERNPSFSYNFLKDTFSCFSCHAKGDIIDLYCQVKGYTDHKEGFKAFLAEYGIEGSPGSTPPPKRQPQPKKKQLPPEEPPPIIPEDVWSQMAPLPDSWIQRLAQKRGWSREIIEALDLRQQTVFLNPKDGKVTKVSGSPDRIAMPIRDDDNAALLNIRLYKEGAKIRKIMSWGKGYGRCRLYPSPALLAPGPVVICEGEADTNCARSQGLNAITQTSKLTIWPDDQKRHFTGRDIIIAYDADQAGQEYADKAAASLSDVAASIRLIEWPDYMGRLADGTWPEKHGQDLTDFFVKHKKTLSDWKALVDTARIWKDQDADPEEPPPSSHEFFDLNLRTGRWTFKPRFLADRILRDLPLMFDPKTGVLYQWGGKYWQDFYEEQVKKRCLEYLGSESTSSRVSDATTQALLLSTLDPGREVNDHPELVCLNNGMVNLKTLDIVPHDRDYYSTYQLNVDFDPKTDKVCQDFLNFLDQTIQTPEPILQLQEFSGYCLTRETRYGKAAFLLGPGADGKSLYLKLLRKLIGPQNCSAVSFKDMEDQFYRSAVYNKLLNISTEVGAAAVGSEYFKAIVTGDPIMAAFKNKTPFEFLPFCKLAFAANKLPRVLDNSDGFFRRVLPISFKRQFFGKDRDTHLEEKLTEQLSEIFVWALVGLHRLWKQDGFTESEETQELLMGYKRLNNPVLCFVEERCEIGTDETYYAEKTPLYKAYKNYCKRNGYTQLNKENFFRELKTAITSLTDYRPRIEGERTQCVKGIRMDATSLIEDGADGDADE